MEKILTIILFMAAAALAIPISPLPPARRLLDEPEENDVLEPEEPYELDIKNASDSDPNPESWSVPHLEEQMIEAYEKPELPKPAESQPEPEREQVKPAKEQSEPGQEQSFPVKEQPEPVKEQPELVDEQPESAKEQIESPKEETAPPKENSENSYEESLNKEPLVPANEDSNLLSSIAPLEPVKLPPKDEKPIVEPESRPPFLLNIFPWFSSFSLPHLSDISFPSLSSFKIPKFPFFSSPSSSSLSKSREFSEQVPVLKYILIDYSVSD